MLGLLILFSVAYAQLLLIAVATILWHMNKPRRKTLGVVLALGGAVEPADLELDAEEVTFNLADGSASPGWIVKGIQADGPLAVVVHGHRDSRYGSLYRAQMLERYCSHIALFDLPGHGLSSGSPASIPDFAVYTRILKDILNQSKGSLHDGQPAPFERFTSPQLIDGRRVIYLGV